MKYLKPFLLGLFIAGGFHFFQFISCDSGDSVSLTSLNGIKVDMKKINEAANKIEEAFASGDPKNVQMLLTEDAKSTYPDILTELDSDRMKSFANDFKNRTIVGVSEIYAEFGFPFQGTTYTVDLALQEDGSFKLMRF
ncbi:MAG: hypothetical protein V1779_06385 [bacterium]